MAGYGRYGVFVISCVDILAFSRINCWLTHATTQLALKASTRWVKGSENHPFETGVFFFKVNTKGVLYMRVIIFHIIVVAASATAYDWRAIILCRHWRSPIEAFRTQCYHYLEICRRVKKIEARS